MARCTIERLMRELGLQGAVRGRAFTTTTRPDVPAHPADLVNRAFVATRPNQLWVADLTYVATWRGFVYVAFVIDVFARCIVGWARRRLVAHRPWRSTRWSKPLYARPVTDGLIHHSDRGGQYLSIRYTERLAESGIEPSVGSVGDSYDNALAESVIGLYKTEVIRRRGPWRHLEAVEFATLAWVDWFNHRRLLEPIGNVPPVEYEQQYYVAQEAPVMVAGVNERALSRTRGGSPMFSSGFLSSISFATVTPSLVMVGEPNFLSSTTLRPLGPRVILTALASWFTPSMSACRVLSPYTICLAIRKNSNL